MAAFSSGFEALDIGFWKRKKLMFYWQITKYDPQNRDADGVYLKDEWTGYGDIGRIFEGKVLTLEDYVKAEEMYIKAVLFFMKCLDIDTLKVISLEQYGKSPKSVTAEGVRIKNNTFYAKEKIAFIIKSILRCKFWCMFESENIRIRFDYNYYMRLACTMPCTSTIAQIELLGLFVQESKRELIFRDEEDE